MAAVKMRCWNSCNKELRSICVWASICHGQKSWGNMLELKVLVLECSTVNALATGPIEVSEVSSLDHERRDDAVEHASLVTISFLSSTDLSHECDKMSAQCTADGDETGIALVVRSQAHLSLTKLSTVFGTTSLKRPKVTLPVGFPPMVMSK
mmetsp:Transcript_20606/g.83641  ORF Transcript_20606/g.83641 Transcript_20606/m.83641 type:complete len:152 (-) Transcript_20606:306-761(-)